VSDLPVVIFCSLVRDRQSTASTDLQKILSLLWNFLPKLQNLGSTGSIESSKNPIYVGKFMVKLIILSYNIFCVKNPQLPVGKLQFLPNPQFKTFYNHDATHRRAYQVTLPT